MASYDSALKELLRVCDSAPGFSKIEKACVVRDLKGCLRLVLKLNSDADLDIRVLEKNLGRDLKKWFSGPVIDLNSSHKQLAQNILNQSKPWPQAWPDTYSDLLGGTKTIDRSRWCSVQRVLGKQSWLESEPADLPWSLTAGNPAIIAFHSFKGGAGRTTTLAILAFQLAKRGKKVICLDLDLEAPGLGTFLSCPASSDINMLECLLSHTATGQLPEGELVQWVTAHGQQIGVIPTGPLNATFLEKLSRLDFLGTTSTSDSPIGLALKALLERIRGTHKPDVILLDCRAGLHDLGGLTLTDLAHVDVLVGRNTPQGIEGMGLVLRTLAARRKPNDQRLLLVQTFVPPSPAQAEAVIASYRSSMYKICVECLYLEDPPDEQMADVAHSPWPVPERSDIAVCGTLHDMDADARESEKFREIVDRLGILIQPEGEGDQP